MIVGLGTDVCDVSRLKKSLEKYGEKFLARFLTHAEINYCTLKKDPEVSAAGRFAAKEAMIKAAGEPLSFQEMEIENNPAGKPEIRVTGGAKQKIDAKEVSSIHLSITHDAGVAFAVVILEKLS